LSGNVQVCPIMSPTLLVPPHARPSRQRRAAPGRLVLGSSKDVVHAEKHTTARRPVAPDLSGDQPSIDGTHLDATQVRHFALRQELLATAVVLRYGSPLVWARGRRTAAPIARALGVRRTLPSLEARVRQGGEECQYSSGHRFPRGDLDVIAYVTDEGIAPSPLS
jgi:hypothetical protein